ncbi:hypothetical protein NE172_04925 [Clostridium botulinum]|uniref:Uncharacterized protein n=1 Tax=Clostridium botulinum TaxID=1491 RepID=A0A6B4JJ29_CLOBO|nr:hypothetical protein [Clostridium botulinum]EES48812.1 hypothetical protein CLO_1356 [Clostridium botulinum E1 str. 'BoNT E Beluga']MBY6760504.1 hypothetical protein [Clostridium botulinum]MBY6919411.1 hypothetical protein [Clostridium botulinum]MCR1130289.1 hypothetical protein [Clostridium botulinum]NFJ56950.1 hypothetical protein [Clostridium botulinum]
MKNKFYKNKWFIAIIISLVLIIGGIAIYDIMQVSNPIATYQKMQKNGNIEDSVGASAKLAIGVDRDVSISVKDNKVDLFLDLPSNITKKELKNEEVRIINEIQKTEYKDYISGLTIQHLTDWKNKENDRDVTALVWLDGDKVKYEYNNDNIEQQASMCFFKDTVKEY